LKSVELFASCTRSERELIRRISTVTDVDREAVLCTSGEKGTTFFLLVQGEARVTVDGREIARLGPGRFGSERSRQLCDECRVMPVEQAQDHLRS
jgi:CRP-like cAMP-binding protein